MVRLYAATVLALFGTVAIFSDTVAACKNRRDGTPCNDDFSRDTTVTCKQFFATGTKCPQGFNRIKSYKKAKCNLLPGKLNFCPDVCCRRRGISPSEYAEGNYPLTDDIISCRKWDGRCAQSETLLPTVKCKADPITLKSNECRRKCCVPNPDAVYFCWQMPRNCSEGYALQAYQKCQMKSDSKINCQDVCCTPKPLVIPCTDWAGKCDIGFQFTAGKQCVVDTKDFKNSCQNNCCKPKPFTGKYNCTCWAQDGNFCGTGFQFINNGVCNRNSNSQSFCGIKCCYRRVGDGGNVPGLNCKSCSNSPQGPAVNNQGIVEGWNLSNDGVNGRRSAGNSRVSEFEDGEELIEDSIVDETHDQ